MSAFCFVRLSFGLILCLSIASESTSECNYWYDQVPNSVNHSVCSITEGSMMSLTCNFYYPCDVSVNAKWYKSNSDGIAPSDEHISILESDKYDVMQPTPGMTMNNNFVECCFGASFLFIRQFNHSDIGYYKCQMISSNILLQPSPYYGHISPSVVADSDQYCVQALLIRQLNPPICAENAVQSVSSRVTCTSTQSTKVTTGAYLNPWVYGTTSRDTEIANLKDNMWVYGTIAGAVMSTTLVVIVFLMGISIVCHRRRTKQQGMDGNSGCHWKVARAHSAEQEVRNPNYIKTTITDNNKENTSECRESHINIYGSKVEIDLSSAEQDLNCGAVNCGSQNATHHSLITESDVDSNTTKKFGVVDPHPESIMITCTQLKYADNRANKKSTPLNDDGKQITMVSSPDYQELADSMKSKDKLGIAAVNVIKLEDVKPLKISQSPLHIYAEVSKNKKKQRPQSNMEGQRPINSSIIGHQRSPSPEYAMVENTKERRDLLVPEYAAAESIEKYCKDRTSNEEEEDQHYYHSLENLTNDSNVTDGNWQWAKVYGSDEYN